MAMSFKRQVFAGCCRQRRFLLWLIYISLVGIFLIYLLLSLSLLLLLLCMCVCLCQNLSFNLPHPSLRLPQMSPMIFRFALTRTLLHFSFFMATHPLFATRHHRQFFSPSTRHQSLTFYCALVYHIL